MTRVFLVDRHELVRDGIKSLLELDNDYVVVGGAKTAEYALAKIVMTLPDLVVVDLDLADCDGLVFLNRLRLLLPQVLVLVLTFKADQDTVVGALASGAQGFLTKDASRSEFYQALAAIAQGGSYVHPLVTSYVVGVLRKSPVSVARFSENELEVIRRILHGQSNATISSELCLSMSTVKTHLRNVFAKMQVSSRTEAAVTALQLGLVLNDEGEGAADRACMRAGVQKA